MPWARNQPDALLAELADDIDEMPHGAAHPVQLGDDQGVAAAQLFAAAVPLRAPGQLPRCLVYVDALAPGGTQRVELAIGVCSRVDTRAYPIRMPEIVSETPDLTVRGDPPSSGHGFRTPPVGRVALAAVSRWWTFGYDRFRSRNDASKRETKAASRGDTPTLA
jgi:hypothetical protein